MRLFLVFVFLCLSSMVQSGNTVEQQLVAAIDRNLSESIAELKQVVNINSGTLNKPGVERVGRVFQQQFDELGFNTEWLPGDKFDRAGHLVASYGNKGPKILMIGHLDTVFAKDDKFQRFTLLPNNKIAGPGMTDMKGGDVIIVAALRALKEQGLLGAMSIRVVLTGDEESSGRPLSLSKKAIVDGAKWADIALGFEDGDSNINTAVIARRGSISWQLEVSGKAAHSSKIFSDNIGYGAVFESARILDQFRQQLDGLGDTTLNPGLFAAGTELEYFKSGSRAEVFGKTNVVAKTALIRGGLRTLSREELAQAKTIMKAIVANNLSHTQANLHFDEGYPAMSPSEGNRKLLALYDQVSQSLGYNSVVAVDPRKAGAADISFAADHVDMALDGLGLMGAGGHTKNEVADMNSFAKNIHKAAVLMYRLSQ